VARVEFCFQISGCPISCAFIEVLEEIDRSHVSIESGVEGIFCEVDGDLDGVGAALLLVGPD
jgi:hypothetical protein